MLAFKSKMVCLPTVPQQFTVISTVGKSHPTETPCKVGSRKNTTMDRSSAPLATSRPIPLSATSLRLSQTTIPHNFIENYSPVTGALLSIPSLLHHSTSAFPQTVPCPLQGMSAEDKASQQTQAGKGTAEKYLSISLPDMNGTARNISDNLLLTGSYGESSRRSFPRNDRKIRLSSGKRAYFKPCLPARWEPLIML